MFKRMATSKKIETLQREIDYYKAQAEVADECIQKFKKQIKELKEKQHEYEVLIQELRLLRKLYPIEDDLK